MIDWLQAHIGLLYVLIGLLVDVVLTILCLFRGKKAAAKDYVISRIDEVLPGYINLAEASGEDGASKLSMVLELTLKRVKRFILKGDMHYWKSLIIEKVEAILSCPQKKENL